MSEPIDELERLATRCVAAMSFRSEQSAMALRDFVRAVDPKTVLRLISCVRAADRRRHSCPDTDWLRDIWKDYDGARTDLREGFDVER